VTADHYSKAAGNIALHGALQHVPVLNIIEQHRANGQVYGNAGKALKTGPVTLRDVLCGNSTEGGNEEQQGINGPERIRTSDLTVISGAL